MKAVDLAVSSILPEDLRQESYDLSKKGMGSLMAEIATRYPDRYAEIAQKLGDLGRKAAWNQAYTTGASDTRQVIDTKKFYAEMDAEIAELRKADLPKDEFEEQRAEIMTRYSGLIEKATMSEAMKQRNGFALAAASGARGNAAHIQAILSTPGVYQDSKGNVIPMFVRNSFGDGVRPAETLAGTYGGRLAVTSTKRATARGGDLLKIGNATALNYNITEQDCGTDNGIALPADDESLRGRVLARGVGDSLPSGSIVDKKALVGIRRTNKPVIVRSAMTCRARHGLCAKCAGLQADGKFPNVGNSIGVTASAGIFEPVVQGGLNCLAEGTLVRMADYTVKEIQHIRPGDLVLGADIMGTTFPVEVLALHDQGIQTVQTYVYGTTPNQSVEITCTAEHPILQITEYWGAKEEALNKTARKLPAGRKSGRPSAVFPREHIAAAGLRNVPLAAVIGYFMGDGIRAYAQQGGINISCACASTIKDLQDLVEPFGLSINKSGRSHDWRISKKTRASGRSSLRLLVTELGLDGKYAHEKIVPQAVWGWDQESVAAFLAGFVAADGSVFRNKEKAPGISMGSTAYPLLEGIKQLLAIRFGIYSSALTKTAAAGTNLHKHDMWAFTITRRDQVMRFSKYVAPHIPGDKGCKLVRYLKEAPHSNFQDLPYYKVRRKKISESCERQCWDLSVDHPDELFVLHNSLIVKNTKHNCLSINDTEVLMADGEVKRIDQIQEGDTVIGYADGVRKPTKVRGYVFQGMQDVSRYSFGFSWGGSVRVDIVATKDHQVLTTAGKRALGEVDHIFFPGRHELSGQQQAPQAGWLGVVSGGCAFAGNGPIWSWRRYVMWSRVRSSGLADLQEGADAISEEAILALEDFASGSRGKTPTAVWDWDDASVLAFVRGFFHMTKKRTRRGADVVLDCRHISPEFLQSFASLLWARLGIPSSIRPKNCLCVSRHLLEDDIPVQHTTGRWLSLRSVEHIGMRPCADISVEAENELFSLANGAVVKNSGMAKARNSFSGLDSITQFLQIPTDFQDRAAVAEKAGIVESVEVAPQGGHIVTVEGEKHMVLPGFSPSVKPGDTVEAGDIISEGLANPHDIVRLRGLGEGRKYYAERFSQMLSDSGFKPDRRNVEIFARAAVDNYQIDDPDEEDPWMPDDLVRENDFLAHYKPAKDTQVKSLSDAKDGYLQAPTLHYTVGTKLTPKMLSTMKDAGVTSVPVSSMQPRFRSEMKRLRTASHDSDDWLVGLSTSYLSSQMRDALERGDETNIAENRHYAPRLAFGADAGKGVFGENIERTGKF